MTESVQALVAESYGRIWVTSGRGLLFQFRLAGMLIGLGIDFIAAKKAFHRTMVTTGVAGLITGGKRFVDVAFELEGLTTDGVNDGMAVAPKLGVFCFETANELESFAGAVVLEDATEKMIETFGAVGSY